MTATLGDGDVGKANELVKTKSKYCPHSRQTYKYCSYIFRHTISIHRYIVGIVGIFIFGHTIAGW